MQQLDLLDDTQFDEFVLSLEMQYFERIDDTSVKACKLTAVSLELLIQLSSETDALPALPGHISKSTGRAFMYSYELAEVLNKRHGDLIHTIRNLRESETDLGTHICVSRYEVRGKKLLCYRIYRQGLRHLTSYLRADKKNAAKVAKLKDALNERAESIEQVFEYQQLHADTDRAMTDALVEHRKKLGKETKQVHHITEQKLCMLIATGHTPADLRKIRSVAEDATLSALLSADEIKLLIQVRQANTDLIKQNSEYAERKKMLTERFSDKRLLSLNTEL